MTPNPTPFGSSVEQNPDITAECYLANESSDLAAFDCELTRLSSIQHIATRWSALPSHIRETILTLAGFSYTSSIESDESAQVFPEIVHQLFELPNQMRGNVLKAVLSFGTQSSLAYEFEIGPIRAALSNYWEYTFGAVPVARLRELMQRFSSDGRCHSFDQLLDCRSKNHLHDELACLLKYLEREPALVGGKETN